MLRFTSMKCTEVFCFLLFLIGAECMWRISVDEPRVVTLSQNIPFSVVFEDKKQWLRENFSWYSNFQQCEFQNVSSPTSKVVCKTSGIFPFGYLSKDDQDIVQTFKSIFVQPTFDCYYWNVRKNVMNATTIKIIVNVKKFSEEGTIQDDNIWTKSFYRLGESPHLIQKRYTLNSEDEEIGMIYNDTTVGWEAYIIPRRNIWLFISSMNDIPNHGCYIRSNKVILSLPKFNLSAANADNLVSMTTEMQNQVVKDPSSHNVELVIYNSKPIFLEGFETSQLSPLKTELILNVLDIKFTTHFTVMLCSSGDVRTWNVDGTMTTLPRDKNGADWLRIFTYRILPKELDHEFDEILLLNDYEKDGYFYTVLLASNNSLTQQRIPICRKSVNCTIHHVEVSVSIGIIRNLLTYCDILHCFQVFCDYYFVEGKWAKEESLDGKVRFKSFVFFPTNSYHMALFTDNSVYQWDGTQTNSRYTGNKPIKSFTVSDDVLLVQLEGEVVYLSYGQADVQKVYLDYLIGVDYDDGDVYIYRVDEESYRKEFMPLMVELDAVTQGRRPSRKFFRKLSLNGGPVHVLEFTTNLRSILYYLDKIDELIVEVELIGYADVSHEVQVIADSNVGIHVNEVGGVVYSKNGVVSIKKNYSLTIKDWFHSEPNESVRTTVLFAPVHYEGYFAEQLKPQAMYLSLGCPFERHLHVVTNALGVDEILKLEEEEGEKHDHEFGHVLAKQKKQTIYVELQTNEELQISFFLYDGKETPLRTISGDFQMNTNVADKDTIIVKSMDEYNNRRFVTCKTAGQFEVEIKVQSSESLCSLETHLILHVTNTQSQRDIITIVSISLGSAVCLVALFISFMFFKKQTERDHAIEAEIQERQQQLRQLTTMKFYQEQMELQNTYLSTNAAFAEIGARRRSSLAARHNSLITQKQVHEYRSSVKKVSIDAVAEED